MRLQLKNNTSFPDQHPAMKAKFDDAVNAINSLNLHYKDVVARYVDEIEVVCGGCFVLDKNPCYPGVDLTVRAQDAQFLPAEIDSSGRDGGKFLYQTAASGQDRRKGGVRVKGLYSAEGSLEIESRVEC